MPKENDELLKEKDTNLNPNEFTETDDVEKDTSNDDDKSSDVEKETDSNLSDEDKSKVKTQKSKDDEKAAEKNKYYAEKRRQREQEEAAKKEQKIRDEAKLEAELGLIKKNPYTNEDIKDKEDLEIYKVQKQLDDEGKDPLSDLPKRLAQINREKAKQVQKEKEEADAIQEKLAKDIQDFHKKHPEVNLSELATNEEYLNFSDGKVGRWTTSEIYEAFQQQNKSKAREQETKKDNQVVDETAKKVTKTPSSNGNGKVSNDPSQAPKDDAAFEKWWNDGGWVKKH